FGEEVEPHLPAEPGTFPNPFVGGDQRRLVRPADRRRGAQQLAPRGRVALASLRHPGSNEALERLLPGRVDFSPGGCRGDSRSPRPRRKSDRPPATRELKAPFASAAPTA